jgi:hypothetical protein
MSELRHRTPAVASAKTERDQDGQPEWLTKESTRIDSAKDLAVYKAAYELAMEIFQLSKHFPPEERYALTSQIRNSSRSICLNLREAWANLVY